MADFLRAQKGLDPLHHLGRRRPHRLVDEQHAALRRYHKRGIEKIRPQMAQSTQSSENLLIKNPLLRALSAFAVRYPKVCRLAFDLLQQFIDALRFVLAVVVGKLDRRHKTELELLGDL